MNKISKTIKKGTILAATLITLSGCIKPGPRPKDYPLEFEYTDQWNEDIFDLSKIDVYKDVISDGKVMKAYKSKNFIVAINKETYEAKKLIYYGPVNSIYDYETGYLIYESYHYDLIPSINKPKNDNYKKLHDEYYLFYLNDINNSLDDVELKEYYTEEEIDYISQLLSETVKKALNKDSSLCLTLGK